MKGLIITLDVMFSLFIFIGLLYFLSSTWNSMTQDLGKQEELLLQLRTQQTLDRIIPTIGDPHRLDQTLALNFIESANYNYTRVKNDLGLEDADMKLIVTDFTGVIVYQTNTTPTGSLVVTSTRYLYLNQPVKLELWVWR